MERKPYFNSLKRIKSWYRYVVGVPPYPIPEDEVKGLVEGLDPSEQEEAREWFEEYNANAEKYWEWRKREWERIRKHGGTFELE